MAPLSSRLVCCHKLDCQEIALFHESSRAAHASKRSDGPLRRRAQSGLPCLPIGRCGGNHDPWRNQRAETRVPPQGSGFLVQRTVQTAEGEGDAVYLKRLANGIIGRLTRSCRAGHKMKAASTAALAVCLASQRDLFYRWLSPGASAHVRQDIALLRVDS